MTSTLKTIRFWWKKSEMKQIDGRMHHILMLEEMTFPKWLYWPCSVQSRSVQLLSCVWLFVTLWTAVLQASLSIPNSWSLLKLMSIELVMPFNHVILCCPFNHVILCHPLLLLPLIFPSIRVFPSESVLLIRWPKYWCFSFSISPSN